MTIEEILRRIVTEYLGQMVNDRLLQQMRADINDELAYWGIQRRVRDVQVIRGTDVQVTFYPEE